MKRYILALAAVAVLAGCTPAPAADTTQPVPTQSEPTTPPEGWYSENGAQYYYADGVKQIGWLQLDGKTYFFGMDGAQRTGWIDSDGKRYYLDPEQGGAVYTGWLELDGKRYILADDGVMKTGWLKQDDDLYYLKSDGSMARGKLELGEETYYFTASGAQILLVNPWNSMPKDYATDVVAVTQTHKVAAVCYEDLMQMLEDCRAEGLNPQIASSYRTWGDQEWLFNRKVNFYLEQGYPAEEAKKLAGTVVAVPGTSEHQLGLALDLVDNSNWNLDETQEKTPVQQWLMKNSWRYGFILRYPNEKSEITGIIYEPWHYRYVGKETAQQVYESGLCLEEYLESLS